MLEPASCPEQDVELAAKVAHLSRPGAYPATTSTVEARETHMSWVFLTDDHAYKLKKPVHYPFLDFTTLEARRANCKREVCLNRRLAPSIYLGTVALSVDTEGKLHLGGPGRIVDWLVKMRRLPAERTLEHAIITGTVREEDVRRLAVRLATFYRGATPVPMAADDYRRRFERDIGEIRDELWRPAFGLPRDLVGWLAAAQLNFLAAHGELLDGRVVAGRIVECHGDLRPEHVYLGVEPVVLDCLEFNREFRILDAVDELAYLAMECDRLGATFIEAWLFDAYRSGTGDVPPRRLVEFYKCHRAYLRAKIAIWHLKEAEVRTPAKWRERAVQYLGVARDCSARLDQA